MTNTERFLEGFGKDRPFLHSKIILFYRTFIPNFYTLTSQLLPGLINKPTVMRGVWSDKQTACTFAIFEISILLLRRFLKLP